MSIVKSEIFVKSTAGLENEVVKELNQDDKCLSELLDGGLQHSGIQRSDNTGNGEYTQETV